MPERPRLSSLLCHALLDPLVVVTIMTTSGFIIGVLPWDASPYSKTAIGLCIGFGLLGTATIIYQVRRIYRSDIARKLISELLAEGLALTIDADDKTIQGQQLVEDWCRRTEVVLRQYLTVWKNNHRLETASFLLELKP